MSCPWIGLDLVDDADSNEPRLKGSGAAVWAVVQQNNSGRSISLVVLGAVRMMQFEEASETGDCRHTAATVELVSLQGTAV